ncbi:MAG: hypothetical protein CL823_07965 [Crocinitomicaceae bacterium]|nr:hypothetical protein [Crocinitomicaceae bacterium]
MNKVLALATMILPVIYLAQTSLESTTYFQQKVDHTIKVELNDMLHELDAEITTTYTNNSPKELSEIWMHLWPNAYSSGKTALAKQQYRDGDLFMYYAIAKDLGGIDGLDFHVNGSDVEWMYDEENPDIAVIKLNTPLYPGESLEIHTPFKVRIPSGKISRLGHVKQSYQITQWYPKPAVYDCDGWHAMPYLGQGEFYSEFGTFDVYITLPDNYTVGATGDMPAGSVDNDAEKLRLDAIDAETRKHLDEEDNDLSFPATSENTKTLHYHQENVHDFAWFADKRYMVLKDQVELPHSGRSVTTWAMFTSNEKELWAKSSDYLNKSTFYYSLWNGDYPYNHVTAVDGTISAGGGMEYPNVTVIGESGTDFQLNVVIAHEVGHNWFYGILGSNERVNAWMDEGLNSFNETRYLTEYYEGKDLGLISNRLKPKLIEKLDLDEFEYRWIDELSYLLPARLGADQPLQCHSDDFSSTNYGAMVYKKTAAVFGFMKQYLGEERFDKAMQAYFEEWKFKHPSPSDLQASMEKSCGEDLSWFFEGWIKTNNHNNWAVCKATETDNGLEVSIKNIGEHVSPVEVVAYNGDVEVGTAWVEPSEPGTKATVKINTEEATHVVVDPGRYDLDYDRKNNYSRTSGVLKKVEPLQIRALTRLEDGSKTQLFVVPTLGWNMHSGFMSGLALHNITVPMRDLEWYANPMMGVSEGEFTLNGTASISLSKGPWMARARGSRFYNDETLGWHLADIYYGKAPMHRLSFEVNRKFNQVVNSPWKSSLGYEYATRFGYPDEHVFTDNSTTQQSHKLRFEASKSNGDIVGFKQNIGIEARFYDLNLYEHSNWLPLPPEGIKDNHNLVAMLNYSADYRLNKRGKRIKMSFLCAYSHSLSEEGNFQLPTNGFGARNDVMGDHLLLERDAQDGLLSRQAPNLYGAMPIEMYAKTWFTSLRFDYNITQSIDLFCGGIVMDLDTLYEDYDAIMGMTYKLGILKFQLPLLSLTQNNESRLPLRKWTFSLNLRDLNPNSLIRKTL